MVLELPDSQTLLAKAAVGDQTAWGTLLKSHEQRLARMVAFRIDPRLRGRVDPADILQDAFVEATEHRPKFFGPPQWDGPLFLWLRGVVSNKLLEVHRHHLGTKMRDAKRERAIPNQSTTSDSSAALCAQLTAGLTRASVAAVRGEVTSRLTEALHSMDPTDREVLALRHFEQLTSPETAQLLGIQERAAAKRYLRRLDRLRQILADMPGGLTELRP